MVPVRPVLPQRRRATPPASSPPLRDRPQNGVVMDDHPRPPHSSHLDENCSAARPKRSSSSSPPVRDGTRRRPGSWSCPWPTPPLETPQHGLLIVDRLHVDEVDNDDPADVSKPQLTPDLLSRFPVVLQNRLLQVRGANEFPGVDIDDGQRLGPIDDQVAARRQIDLPVEGLLDLIVDVVSLEERDLVGVVLDLGNEVGSRARK